MDALESAKELVWENQGRALRDPAAILCGGTHRDCGVVPESLRFEASPGFATVLEELGIVLLITREYEHLVIALGSHNGMLRQSFICLPHPSGLAVDREKGAVFVAATRNPNQILEFLPTQRVKVRSDVSRGARMGCWLMPARTKFYPGCSYFHDLAIVNGGLYANSVGQNGVQRVDFDHPAHEDLVWWPKSIEDPVTGRPDFSANYLQLNSISGGETIEDCFFSASVPEPGRVRPGDPAWEVDRKGVVFHGRTREVYATGLTRPHSARLHSGELWVNNSGYGETGVIEDGAFHPRFQLPGWTRGLCFHGDILAAGVSRVLPRFRAYAPGLDPSQSQTCGIILCDRKKGTVVASLRWPWGNQIFSIDWIPAGMTDGFLHEDISETAVDSSQSFYQYHHV